MKIIKFIQNKGNSNIMILGIPHRYDLVEYSCVNRAIQVFNHKLNKVANSFNFCLLVCCQKNLQIRIYKMIILPVVLYGCETWSLTLKEEID
jgi:hypothetical protein